MSLATPAMKRRSLLQYVIGFDLVVIVVGIGLLIPLQNGALTLLFIAAVFVAAWRGGWKARLVAAPLLIELAYDLFIQAVFVRSLYDLARGRSAAWHHVAASATVHTAKGG